MPQTKQSMQQRSQRLPAIADATEEKEMEPASQRRKKLWQIPSAYHCSVIGTCLNRRDLGQIARKKIFSLESGVNAFGVHRSLSAIACERQPRTRALHKMLDLKFKNSVRRYTAYKSDEEILCSWKKDLKDGGAIAGAYWAIMTLPNCTKELLDEVYGDCHMASFDIFSSYADSSKTINALKKKLATVQSRLERTRAASEKEREDIRWEREELQKSKGEFLRQRLINEQLIKENRDLKTRINSREEAADATPPVKVPSSLQEENNTLMLTLKQTRKETAQTIAALESKLSTFQTLNRELQEELISMEEMFQLGMGSKAICDSCEEKKLSNCEGVGLSGKAVLYVGGRHNMVAHYREMVEKYGGIFLHHDGGKESSRNLLPKMLSGADAVLCPIDCVSHDACKCVKKMCKRSCKPFVMMRSSGLSSLAKGLETIIQ